jgi:hypothetical protein
MLHLKLQKALDLAGNTHDIDDVLDAVVADKAQVWSEKDRSLVVTEIIDTPHVSTLRFWLAAGELDDVLILIDRALAWAKENGCHKAVFHGRKGWKRVLTDWKESDLITMELDI